MDQQFHSGDYDGIKLLAAPGWRKSWSAYVDWVYEMHVGSHNGPIPESGVDGVGVIAGSPKIRINYYPLINPLGNPPTIPRNIDSLIFDWKSPTQCFIWRKRLKGEGIECVYSYACHQWFLSKRFCQGYEGAARFLGERTQEDSNVLERESVLQRNQLLDTDSVSDPE